MKIAVVGGGLFGCTAAIHLARDGHEVHLYERAGALMQAASGVNQGRLHEGFHYPRSPETVKECQAGLASFRREYRRAIAGAELQYYVVAREGSRVSAAAYRDFCARHRLAAFGLGSAGCPYVDYSRVQGVFSVREERLDLCALRSTVVSRLQAHDVRVQFAPARAGLRDEFDRIVIAAYASTNQVAIEIGAPTTPLQFEVVEKPIVRMPAAFRGVGVVVMDGPFGCIDPWGRPDDGLHVMGHVEHAIHASNVGLVPVVPAHLAAHVNRGMVLHRDCAAFSHFDEMAEAGQEFIPALAEAEWLGSMFTVRAVLPHRDATDERPTLVEQLDEQVIRIFGGKLSCAVDAGIKTADMIRRSANQRAAA